MKKGIGGKMLGWFIVDEEAEASGGGEETREDEAAQDDESAPAHARGPAPRAARPAPAPAPAPAPGAAHGAANDARAFASVYRAAGVSDEERDRLGKVTALLDSLPAEANVDVKRAIVGASLEAFGVSIDGILASGEGALAALDGYVSSGQSRTRDALAQSEARIAKLTAEIEEVRRSMDLQVAAQQELARATTAEKGRVRVVLDFFEGADRGRSAPPAPRLVRLK